MSAHKDLCMNVCSNLIHSSTNLDTIEMPIHRRMDKEILVYLYHATLFSNYCNMIESPKKVKVKYKRLHTL